MTILDANGLIYCLDNDKPFPLSSLIITEELGEEYQTALAVNGNRKLELKEAAELSGYDEAYYLKEYAYYLNTFSRADLSSMRGIADVTILALVSCIINSFGNSLQTQLELGGIESLAVTVISRDKDLVRRLTKDFGDKVNIVNPTTL